MTSKEVDEIATATIGVLKKVVDPIKAELAALRHEVAELKTRLLLKDAGLWRHGSVYVPGDVVQFKGSPWICTKGHTANGNPDHACFRLWLKTGKDQR